MSKQSKIDSFMETVTNTTIGFVVSLITWGQNLGITAIFTVVSVVRGYILRRAFNGRSVWQTIRSKSYG
jgi:N-acyl-L-homoserine lactone synthetase